MERWIDDGSGGDLIREIGVCPCTLQKLVAYDTQEIAKTFHNLQPLHLKYHGHLVKKPHRLLLPLRGRVIT